MDEPGEHAGRGEAVEMPGGVEKTEIAGEIKAGEMGVIAKEVVIEETEEDVVLLEMIMTDDVG